MELYHGTTLTIEKPVIMNRFSTLDFGTGFYTTSRKEQAEEFASKTFARRGKKGAPTVNVYRFDPNLFTTGVLQALRFEAPDESWLDFIVHNRRYGRDQAIGADVIIGPVANDNVFRTIELYESGDLSKNEAIERFRVNLLFDQYLFATPRALDFLQFSYAYEVV